MRSVWIALGLFFTLWWTWVGFAVLYNRLGADAPRAAAAVPGRRASRPASPRSRSSRRRPATARCSRSAWRVTRLVLAGAHASTATARTCCASGSPAPTWPRRRCSRSRSAVPEPWRYVLWAVAIAVESARCSRRTARRRARRAATTTSRRCARPTRGGARRAPLRRALRAVPDHPARRGGRRGRPGLGGRPRGDGRRLGRAGRRDDPRRRAVVAVLRLRGRDQPAGARALRRLADDGPRDLRRRPHAAGVRAADHRGRASGCCSRRTRRGSPTGWPASGSASTCRHARVPVATSRGRAASRGSCC